MPFYRVRRWLPGRALSRALGLAAGALGLAACSGGHNSTATAVGIAKNDLSAAMAAAHCNNIAACCTRSGYAYDAATCQQNARDAIDAMIARYAPLAVTYDPATAELCVKALAADATACVSSASSASSLDACNDMFRPQRAPGSICVDNVECQHPPGLTGHCALDPMTGGTPTRCEDVTPTPPPMHAKVGEGCVDSCTTNGNGTSCAGMARPATAPPSNAACYTSDGLFCDSATNLCRTLPNIGEPCQSDCVGDAYCSAGTCIAASASGPCTLPAACITTSYCDYTSRTCIPKLGDGAACASSLACLTGGCENQTCGVDTVASVDACAGKI